MTPEIQHSKQKDMKTFKFPQWYDLVKIQGGAKKFFIFSRLASTVTVVGGGG